MENQGRFFVIFAVLAFSGVSAGKTARGVVEVLQVTNGLNRGDWGLTDLCVMGTYANGFEIKYAELGFIDDTAVNAAKLYCYNGTTFSGYVTSTEGIYGTWRGIRSCPAGQYYVGMQLNVVPDQGGTGDDLGVDNIQMMCQGGQILDGQTGIPIENDDKKAAGIVKLIGILPPEQRRRQNPEDTDLEASMRVKEKIKIWLPNKAGLGIWSGWANCSPGLYICGIRTRVERESTVTDDAGLCDLEMYCCD